MADIINALTNSQLSVSAQSALATAMQERQALSDAQDANHDSKSQSAESENDQDSKNSDAQTAHAAHMDGKMAGKGHASAAQVNVDEVIGKANQNKDGQGTQNASNSGASASSNQGGNGAGGLAGFMEAAQSNIDSAQKSATLNEEALKQGHLSRSDKRRLSSNAETAKKNYQTSSDNYSKALHTAVQTQSHLSAFSEEQHTAEQQQSRQALGWQTRQNQMEQTEEPQQQQDNNDSQKNQQQSSQKAAAPAPQSTMRNAQGNVKATERRESGASDEQGSKQGGGEQRNGRGDSFGREGRAPSGRQQLSAMASGNGAGLPGEDEFRAQSPHAQAEGRESPSAQQAAAKGPSLQRSSDDASGGFERAPTGDAPRSLAGDAKAARQQDGRAPSQQQAANSQAQTRNGAASLIGTAQDPQSPAAPRDASAQGAKGSASAGTSGTSEGQKRAQQPVTSGTSHAGTPYGAGAQGKAAAQNPASTTQGQSFVATPRGGNTSTNSGPGQSMQGTLPRGSQASVSSDKMTSYSGQTLSADQSAQVREAAKQFYTNMRDLKAGDDPDSFANKFVQDMVDNWGANQTDTDGNYKKSMKSSGGGKAAAKGGGHGAGAAAGAAGGLDGAAKGDAAAGSMGAGSDAPSAQVPAGAGKAAGPSQVHTVAAGPGGAAGAQTAQRSGTAGLVGGSKLAANGSAGKLAGGSVGGSKAAAPAAASSGSTGGAGSGKLAGDSSGSPAASTSQGGYGSQYDESSGVASIATTTADGTPTGGASLTPMEFVQLVMMQAFQEAGKDAETMAVTLQNQTTAKANLRATEGTLQKQIVYDNTTGHLSDAGNNAQAQLDNVEASVDSIGDDNQLAMIRLQNLTQLMTTMSQATSNVSKSLYDTEKAVIGNIGH